MKPTILLFDSGMGGLSVYDALRQTLPNAHYLYAFDNAGFPYSEKAEAVLIARAVKIVEKITQVAHIDLLVIACNTASTVVLPALRTRFNFPIVGTVPAIKPAAMLSKTKTIGLLATKGTVKRPYVDDLIAKYAPHCVVERIGSTELAQIAEEKQRTGKVDMARLQSIVAAWRANPALDTVILGCTHFPLVQQELQLLLPNVKFVDSGKAIAKRVADLLRFLVPRKKITAPQTAFCTEKGTNFAELALIMQKWGFEELTLLSGINE